MSISMRPYQEAAIQDVRASISRQIKAGKTPSLILTAPTGSGKTAMASFMTESHVQKGGTVYFVCHRRELIDQTSGTFDKVGIKHGLIASGYNANRRRPVQVCSVGTLINRLDQIATPSLVIWDECHHVGAKTWATIRERWSKSIHVGLTATPQRLDGKGLGSWFNELVLGPTVSDLIENGFLSSYEIYAPVTPTTFHKRAGDFVKSEMEAALGKGEIMGGIVEQWAKRAKGLKTIGFAVSVKHSEAIVDAFRSAGIKAAHLDAKSAPWTRRAVLQSFARGEVEVLFNVDLFGEGFDLAANSGMDVTIESVILARPTASLGLHLQQVGRALRPKAKPAIILDHAGNTVRHGFPDDLRLWSLEDSELSEKAPATKICPSCFAVVRPHIMVCPHCGHVWQPSKSREIVEVEGDLVKLERGGKRDRESETRTHLAHLKRIELQRGLPDGWAESTLSAWIARQSVRSAHQPG